MDIVLDTKKLGHFVLAALSFDTFWVRSLILLKREDCSIERKKKGLNPTAVRKCHLGTNGIFQVLTTQCNKRLRAWAIYTNDLVGFSSKFKIILYQSLLSTQCRFYDEQWGHYCYTLQH